MKPKSFLLLLNLTYLFFLLSCNAFDSAEKIPAYIQIDTSLFVINDPIKEGSASHKITDAWVYVNGTLVGTYETPTKFPVLEKGDCDITVMPGIKMNGIGATRINYLMYKPYQTRLNLSELNSHTLKPIYSYHETLKFPFKEDFEVGNSFDTYLISDTVIVKTQNPGLVFEGNYSGAIYLNESKTYFKAKSVGPTPIKLPGLSKPVFLELNYKANNTFVIGFGAKYNADIYEKLLIIINPSADWNKIYINLTEETTAHHSALEHFFYIEAGLNSGVSNAEIFIDNIKIVHSE
jgi:hypothetical protein